MKSKAMNYDEQDFLSLVHVLYHSTAAKIPENEDELGRSSSKNLNQSAKLGPHFTALA